MSSFTPRQGSVRGGAKVQINGDGFSPNCSLNQVSFGDYECQVVSCSKTLLTCNTKNVYQTHNVDNSGSDPGKQSFLFIYNFGKRFISLVELDLGKGYRWSQPYLKINLGDYVKWKWSAPSLVTGLKYKIEQVEDGASTNKIGFASGDATPTGIFD